MPKCSISLDQSLMARAKTRLESRGITVEKYITLLLRVFVNSPASVLSLQDEMPFGKFRGELIEDICRAEPGYMEWIMSQTQIKTPFDDEVLQLLVDLRSKENKSNKRKAKAE